MTVVGMGCIDIIDCDSVGWRENAVAVSVITVMMLDLVVFCFVETSL